MNTDTSLQAAYLLHYTTYRDTSFIVDMFTLNHGRVSMLAKGGRSSKPRTRALYQPFRPLLVSWVGRSELHTLTGIEESGAAPEFSSRALACAYYLNELLLRLLGKEQAHSELFAHYAVALTQLTHEPDINVEITLRTFEVQLLETLGLLPDLSHCTSDGDTVDAVQQYLFHPANAVAVPVPEPGGAGERSPAHDNPAWQADGVTADKGVAVQGKTLLAIAELDFADSEVREQAKLVMRRLLRIHLGGRPLRSRSLFDSMVQVDA